MKLTLKSYLCVGLQEVANLFLPVCTIHCTVLTGLLQGALVHECLATLGSPTPPTYSANTPCLLVCVGGPYRRLCRRLHCDLCRGGAASARRRIVTTTNTPALLPLFLPMKAKYVGNCSNLGHSLAL